MPTLTFNSQHAEAMAFYIMWVCINARGWGLQLRLIFCLVWEPPTLQQYSVIGAETERERQFIIATEFFLIFERYKNLHLYHTITTYHKFSQRRETSATKQELWYNFDPFWGKTAGYIDYSASQVFPSTHEQLDWFVITSYPCETFCLICRPMGTKLKAEAHSVSNYVS